ncbi:MAG: DUF3179 domain-containing protein [Terriglobia bacterium]
MMGAAERIIPLAALISVAALLWPGSVPLAGGELKALGRPAGKVAGVRGVPGELSQQPIVNLLGLLTNRDKQQRRAAYRELKRRRDPRAVAGLVELLRIRKYREYGEAVKLLREFTGENFGNNWVAWSEWLTKKESVELPPQFLAFKAALFRVIDPAYGKFLYPGVPLRIRVEEIIWGGVKKDEIPALTQPKLVQADEADYLRGRDRVFGVEINGDARAYPLRIMNWHEMVNDVVGGQPISLAYCTMCRSGVLFATRVEGKTFTFGSSGLLYRSNKLMYDHQTESLWMQLMGEPVAGRLAESGIKLKVLPVVVTTWKEWRRKHPKTQVLSLETGYKKDYSHHELYSKYFASPDPWFPVRERDKRVKPKEEVFTLVVNGRPKAYVVRKLRGKQVVNDTLGGEKIVLVTNGKTGAVRAYRRGERRFEARKSSDEVADSQDGSVWSVREAALVARSSGERLPRVAGHVAYWFAWYLFYPQTLLYAGKE